MMALKGIQATYLRDGYSRGKDGSMDGWYRDLTTGEAKTYTGPFYAVDRMGRIRNVRRNGRAKTWKTFPGCELSLAYGLYEKFRVGSKEQEPSEPIGHNPRIVVPVRQAFPADCPEGIVTDFVLENEI